MRIPILVAASVLVPAILGCGDDVETPVEPRSATAQRQTTAAAAGGWALRADYPREIWYAASASVTDPSTGTGTVYVIGGAPVLGGPGRITDAVKAYDVTADAWRSKAPYPLRVKYANGAAEIGGKIYVSGGWTRKWNEQRGAWEPEALKSLHVYDPATNQWTRRRDMPVATAAGLTVVYQGLLYVVTPCFTVPNCGAGLPAEGVVWRYNPSTDRWALHAYTPHDAFSIGGGIIAGKLYLVGWQGATDIYDFTTGTWSSGPAAPASGCGQPSATLQAKLYLVACSDPESGDLVTVGYDPKSGSWTKQPAPRGSGGTATRVFVNGQARLELIGGAQPENNWQFTP